MIATTDETITLVCSFPRAGSSLTMAMLHAGGMDVHAENTASYEHDDVLTLPHATRWLDGVRGKAVKVLDPQRYRPPQGYAYRAIWLSRDPEQQARSQLKLMGTVLGEAIRTDTQMVTRLARSFGPDLRKALRLLEHRTDGRLLRLRFEDIITDPKTAARAIATFIPGLDADVMAAVVRVRAPECLPYVAELYGGAGDALPRGAR